MDKNGVNIPKVGDLPLGCAAVCAQSINVQRLSVAAAVHADRNLLIQAMMLDPLTGAVCNTYEIEQMVDEMLVAGEKWLPQYKDEIAKAKVRLQNPKVQVKDGYKGAARLHTKTIDEMLSDRNAATKNAAEADKAKQE